MAVAEIVVTRAHVMESARLSDAEETSIIIGGSIIKLGKFTAELAIVGSGGGDEFQDNTRVLRAVLELVGLVELALIVEMSGEYVTLIQERDNVRTIALLAALTIVVGRVCVRAGPGQMNIIVGLEIEIVGSEIIFSARKSLHDVTTFSADHQRIDGGIIRNDIATRADGESVRAILEGATVLCGVNGELELDPIADVDGGVVLKGVRVCGAKAGSKVELEAIDVVERSVGVPPVVVVGRDVVAKSQGTTLMDVIGDGPVVGRGFATKGVTKVVVTSPRSTDAFGRGDVPGAKFFPDIAQGFTGGTVVDGVDLLVRVGAVETVTLVDDVLGLLLEEITAAIHVISEDGNVLPGSGVPVRIVIPLFGALKAISVAVGVLTSELGGFTIQLLGSSEKSLVSFAGGAALIVIVRFVTTIFGVTISEAGVGNSVGGGPIAQPVITHVLKNQITKGIS